MSDIQHSQPHKRTSGWKKLAQEVRYGSIEPCLEGWEHFEVDGSSTRRKTKGLKKLLSAVSTKYGTRRKLEMPETLYEPTSPLLGSDHISSNTDIHGSLVAMLCNVLRVFHKHGAPFYVATFYVHLVAARWCLEVKLTNMVNTVWMSIVPSNECRMIQTKWGFSLSGQVEVAHLMDTVLEASKAPCLSTLSSKLNDLAHPPPQYPRWMRILALMVLPVTIAPLYGVGYMDLVFSIPIGIVSATPLFVSGSQGYHATQEAFQTFIAAVLVHLCDAFITPLTTVNLTLACVAWSLPTFSLNLGMMEMGMGNTLTGLGKIMNCAFTFAQMAIGLVGGIAFAQLFKKHEPQGVTNLVPIWVKVIACVALSFCGQILLDGKRRHTLYYVFAILIAYFTASLCTIYAGFGPFSAGLAGSFAVAAAGNVYGRITYHLSTEFSSFGSLVLLPGSLSLKSLFATNSEGALEVLTTFITIHIAVTVGFMLANVFVPPRVTIA